MNYHSRHSFDSLDQYCLDATEFLNDYEIHSEKFKDGHLVMKGFLKNTSQAVKILRKTFPLDRYATARFKKLIDAFNLGIILADNIFLSKERSGDYDSVYYLFIIEPRFLNWNDKFMQLDNVLKLDLPYQRKKHLFFKMTQALEKLHSLNVPHLQICPKNIWVEDQQQVYLRPFKLDFQEIKKDFFSSPSHCHSASFQTTSSASWYIAPEVYYLEEILATERTVSESTSHSRNDGFFTKGFSSDIWGLGCIFGEMFVSLTPIFQTIDTGDKFFKFFDVLGIPSREDAFYIDAESFKKIINTLRNEDEFNEREGPMIEILSNRLNGAESEILRRLLHINPLKRPDPESLLNFDFFSPEPVGNLKNPGKSSNEKPKYRTLSNTSNFALAEDTLGNNQGARSGRSYQNLYETVGGIKDTKLNSGPMKEFASPNFNDINYGEKIEKHEEFKNWKQMDNDLTPASDDIRKSISDVFHSKEPKGSSSGKREIDRNKIQSCGYSDLSARKENEELNNRAKGVSNSNSKVLRDVKDSPEEDFNFEVLFRIKTSKIFIFRKEKPRNLALKAFIGETETTILSSFIPISDIKYEFSSEIELNYQKLKKNLSLKKLSIKFYEKIETLGKTKIELFGVAEVDMCMVFLDLEEKIGFNKIYLTGWHGIYKPDTYSSRTIGKIKAEFSVRSSDAKNVKKENSSKQKSSFENSSFVSNRPPRPLSVGLYTTDSKSLRKKGILDKESSYSKVLSTGKKIAREPEPKGIEKSSAFSSILQDMEELNDSLLKKDQESFYFAKKDIRPVAVERSRSSEKEKIKTIDKLKNILFGEE